MWAVKNLFTGNPACKFDTGDGGRSQPRFPQRAAPSVLYTCMRSNTGDQHDSLYKDKTLSNRGARSHFIMTIKHFRRGNSFQRELFFFVHPREESKQDQKWQRLLRREIKQKKQQRKHLLKKYSARTPVGSWANICPSNRVVCRWNSQLGSRAVMRGREWETICHRWVTLRSWERGPFSCCSTQTHTCTVCAHSWHPGPDTYLHRQRQHSWQGGQRWQNSTEIQVN